MKTILIPITKEVTEVEWDRINLFRKRFGMLWKNFKDLKIGTLTGSFSKAGHKYTGSFELPNEFRLKGLYVDYRHFYSKKEDTNLFKFINYLSTLTDSNEYREFLKREKTKCKSDFLENGWFNCKGQTFTTKMILDIWFNAEIFHNDGKKSSTLLRWLEILETDTAKSMLFFAVYDTMLIIRNINWSINELSEQNMTVKMPKHRQLHS